MSAVSIWTYPAVRPMGAVNYFPSGGIPHPNARERFMGLGLTYADQKFFSQPVGVGVRENLSRLAFETSIEQKTTKASPIAVSNIEVEMGGIWSPTCYSKDHRSLPHRSSHGNFIHHTFFSLMQECALKLDSVRATRLSIALGR